MVDRGASSVRGSLILGFPYTPYPRPRNFPENNISSINTLKVTTKSGGIWKFFLLTALPYFSKKVRADHGRIPSASEAVCAPSRATEVPLSRSCAARTTEAHRPRAGEADRQRATLRGLLSDRRIRQGPPTSQTQAHPLGMTRVAVRCPKKPCVRPRPLGKGGGARMQTHRPRVRNAQRREP